MENALRQALAGFSPESAPATPLAKAQALIYRAFEEPDEKRRGELARQALEISPDCADAYLLLAEHAGSRKKSLELYQQALAAGERALGREAFERHVGQFWGLPETRPFMRAREELASALWAMGRREEAIEHLREMLRLNPNDNQGVRYTLAAFLLFLDRDQELADLLVQFPEECSAAWAYTKALLTFRQQGDTIEARRLLKQARKCNKYVLPYLTGEKFPPAQFSDYYRIGDKNEALHYIVGFLAAWRSTPGAVAWVRANLPDKKSAPLPAPKGPLGIIKKWLTKHLSQEFDVWQADVRPLPEWIRIGDKPVRPLVGLIASRTHDLVLSHPMMDEPPTPEHVWDALVQAMQHPLAGSPHRPSELQVLPDPRWETLRPHLEEIGINLVITTELDLLEGMFSSMVDHVLGPRRPGLLDAPGVTPELVGRVYEAAAAFFQRAPWKRVGHEAAIQVECAKFSGGPWYAVLMGQSGLTFGLTLYEDLDALREMWTSNRDDRENARRSVATTITFGEEWDVAAADVEAARQHGWPIARSDAYPEIFHKERGLSVRLPLVWELELMEACLRAIPEFVTRQPQDSLAREELTVPVAAGDLKLTLSWVPEEEEK